jgi:hypothetical protein
MPTLDGISLEDERTRPRRVSRTSDVRPQWCDAPGGARLVRRLLIPALSSCAGGEALTLLA